MTILHGSDGSEARLSAWIMRSQLTRKPSTFLQYLLYVPTWFMDSALRTNAVPPAHHRECSQINADTAKIGRLGIAFGTLELVG